MSSRFKKTKVFLELHLTETLRELQHEQVAELAAPRDPQLDFTRFENSIFVWKQALVKVLGINAWKFMITLYCLSIERMPITLREKCPNVELFLVRIFLYSGWKMRTRNNSVFGHFSRSVNYLHSFLGQICG